MILRYLQIDNISIFRIGLPLCCNYCLTNQLHKMKKVILSVAALIISMATFAQETQTNSNIALRKYISKNVNQITTYAVKDYQGMVKVKIELSETGVPTVKLISGVNDELDSKVMTIIRNTPEFILAKMVEQNQKSLIIPVRFEMRDN